MLDLGRVAELRQAVRNSKALAELMAMCVEDRIPPEVADRARRVCVAKRLRIDQPVGSRQDLAKWTSIAVRRNTEMTQVQGYKAGHVTRLRRHPLTFVFGFPLTGRGFLTPQLVWLGIAVRAPFSVLTGFESTLLMVLWPVCAVAATWRARVVDGTLICTSFRDPDPRDRPEAVWRVSAGIPAGSGPWVPADADV